MQEVTHSSVALRPLVGRTEYGMFCINQVGMFIVMAIDTQPFPVTTVFWIIVVVMVAMVDGQFTMSTCNDLVQLIL